MHVCVCVWYGMYACTYIHHVIWLVQVLCKKITDDNMWSMVSHLMEGLADYQSQSSSGACVVLNGVVKTRMAAILTKVAAVPYSVNFWRGKILMNCPNDENWRVKFWRMPKLQNILINTHLRFFWILQDWLHICWVFARRAIHCVMSSLRVSLFYIAILN